MMDDSDAGGSEDDDDADYCKKWRRESNELIHLDWNKHEETRTKVTHMRRVSPNDASTATDEVDDFCMTSISNSTPVCRGW